MTIRKHISLMTFAAAAFCLAACGTDESSNSTSADAPATTNSPLAPDTNEVTTRREHVEGVVVRFSARGEIIDVTLGPQTPTSRDFISRLPMSITLEEFAGREKIGYLEPRLQTGGSPGSDPEDGDLIYFVPWGNLGFYYNAEGIEYSDDTINLGKYTATPQQLDQLEGPDVKITLLAG